MAGTGLRPWGDKREPKRPGSPSWGARGQALAAMRGQLTWQGGPEASTRPQKLAQTLGYGQPPWAFVVEL